MSVAIVNVQWPRISSTQVIRVGGSSWRLRLASRIMALGARLGGGAVDSVLIDNWTGRPLMPGALADEVWSDPSHPSLRTDYLDG
jgi:hypothetical protein